jgi:hypothetical protein
MKQPIHLTQIGLNWWLNIKRTRLIIIKKWIKRKSYLLLLAH